MRAKILTAAALTTALVTTAVVLGGPSCGVKQHPLTATLSLEGKVAVYGRQVIAAADSALTTIDQLVTQNPTWREAAIPVVRAIREMGVQGQRLADALRIIDDSRDTVSQRAGLAKAAEIIRQMQRAIGEAVVPIPNENMRKAIAAALQGITDVLLNLAIVLPPATPPTSTAATLTPWHGGYGSVTRRAAAA